MARCKMQTKHAHNPAGKKQIYRKENPGSYYHTVPTFSFTKYDSNAPWSKSEDGKPVVDDILKILRGFEGMYWKDIMQSSGARSHGTNNHHIQTSELSLEAQKRMKYIGLYEDYLFSMHLSSKVRLWGIIKPDDGRFYVIWYDPRHKVYEVKK